MKVIILKQQSALCAALIAMMLHFSLWAQTHPDKSIKEPSDHASVSKHKVHTFFLLAENGTGFVPMLKASIATTVPFNLAGSTWTVAVQSTYMLRIKHVLLVNNIEYFPHFTKGERLQLDLLLDLAPSFFSNPISYYYKLLVLDGALEVMEAETRVMINTPKIGKDLRKDIAYKLHEIRNIRSELGVSERKISNNEEWLKAKPGHWLVFDPNRKIYVHRQKFDQAK